MPKRLYSWLYYTLGQEDYKKCMKKMFVSNLSALRLLNTLLAGFTIGSIFFPIFVERNMQKAGIYLVVIIIAVMLAIISGYGYKQHEKGKHIPHFYIYLLVLLYYTNGMFLSLYIGVFENTIGPAVLFMGFVICALFLIISPPIYNLILTVTATITLVISSIIIKSQNYWVFDVTHAVVFGCISIVLTWYFVKFRLSATLNAIRLEDERNKFLSQSMIDELTQVNNRRSFMQTFKRSVTNHRETDKYLCLAIIDIDFFKRYNDYYGHPKGDECLQDVGKALKELPEDIAAHVARIGGEEFALLWFAHESEGIDDSVQTIHQKINSLKISHETSPIAEHLTICIGVYVSRCGSSNNTEDIYSAADNALYEAKNAGRNCTVIDGDDIEKQLLRLPE